MEHKSPLEVVAVTRDMRLIASATLGRVVKMLKKNKVSKSDIKAAIQEARVLKAAIEDCVTTKTRQVVEVALCTEDNKITLRESCSSSGIELLDVRYVGGLLIIEVIVVT